ncbi:MAG TPA: proline--tRNA ligase [Thermomicrobiales bacterium]|nr:proline--tRNA ligase [Thermomicrobiales bacterium]
MRYSQLFGKTLRDAPAGTETTSAALLARAGFTRQLGAGIHSYLPLAWRSIRKIEQIIREEMEHIGCYELSMPVVQPADLWQESGRLSEIGGELARFKDRSGRDMVLAMTHEEVATDLVRREVRSYRQLPVTFFQIQTKFRDEPRPRAGLIRGREFLMKDAYSFHADEADLDRFYDECNGAYKQAFERCDLPVMVVEAAAGIMGGSGSHEYMLLAAAGEDVLLLCPNADYAANREVATTTLDLAVERPAPIEEVATPESPTIEAVATYLGVGTDRTLKAVFYDVDGRLVFVAIRGDIKVNEHKLMTLLGAKRLAPADEALIRASGAAPGYASPINVHDALVVADLSARAPNLVAGANREGIHLRNVNLGRDFAPDIVADIAMVEAGAPCPLCGLPLEETRGIEVANIFKLGTKYSGPLNARYLDDGGVEHPILMGSYGFGVSRALAAIAEHHHDERGLCWPVTVGPFVVHLVSLGEADEVREAAKGAYEQWTDAGFEVLYDDRDESAGVKFADADLIGIPIRATISARSLKAGGVELKLRRDDQDAARIVPLADALGELETLRGGLLARRQAIY